MGSLNAMPTATGSTNATGTGNNPVAPGGAAGSNMMDLALFDKDFECSVCLDDMKPPVKIFQCRNGHVMCEPCKNHPEVITCPTCRIPLPGPNALMRNIPMEKLARSYFDQLNAMASSNRQNYSQRPGSRSRSLSRRGSYDNRNNASSSASRLNSNRLSQSSEMGLSDW